MRDGVPSLRGVNAIAAVAATRPASSLAATCTPLRFRSASNAKPSAPPARSESDGTVSFLEVNAHRARIWIAEGRCDLAQAQAKLDWMRDRVRVPAAIGPARELHARAVIA